MYVYEDLPARNETENKNNNRTHRNGYYEREMCWILPRPANIIIADTPKASEKQSSSPKQWKSFLNIGAIEFAINEPELNPKKYIEKNVAAFAACSGNLN